MQQIKAAILRAPHSPFVIESARLDSPREQEVLVELVATGICHSDLAVVEQIVPLPTPILLGHEGAGIVREVGKSVTGLAPGDPVVLSFGSCGTCGQCAGGVPAYCESFPLLNMSARRADGSATVFDARNEPLSAAFFSQSSFATHALSNVRNTIKVPREAPLKYLGPLGCGFMTGAGTVLNVLRPQRHSSLLILGMGAVGFAALFAAKLAGCERVIAVDRVKSRLDLARELGASDVIDTSAIKLDEALAAVGGVELALDTTGVPALLEATVRHLKVRGVLALVGASRDKTMTADILHMISGRVIRGAVEGEADPVSFIPFLVDKFLKGQFPIDRLAGFYPFEQINTAVKEGLSGKTIKPIVTF